MSCVPVPDAVSRRSIGDVSLGTLVEDLTGSRVPRHLSLYSSEADGTEGNTSRRRPGWRPAFFQVDDRAASLLRLEKVSALVRTFSVLRLVPTGGSSRRGLDGGYVRHTSSVHRLFSWLQVSEVRSGWYRNGRGSTQLVLGCSGHPHVNGQWSPSDTIVRRDPGAQHRLYAYSCTRRRPH